MLTIHDRLLSSHGGAAGLRDRGLLASALARPLQHYACGASSDIIELAAIYSAGIIRNHPFVDGNKRTGFVAGIPFLELRGFNFKASEEDATHAVFDLASSKLDEVGYAVWLRTNVKRRARR